LSGQTFTFGPTTANAPTSPRSERIVFSRIGARSPTRAPAAHTVSVICTPWPTRPPSHSPTLRSSAPSPISPPAPPTPRPPAAARHAPPEQHRPAEADVPRDRGTRLAPQRRLLDLAPLARQHELNTPSEHVLVRPPILVQVADVAPVAVRHVAEQGRTLAQHLREQVAREVHVRPRRDPFERLRLEHVDARVDRVAEDLAPRGLLEEALDPPRLVVNDHDAERERVLHRGQRDAGLGAARL